ncbi:histidine phosphatase family (branch 2) protein (macronuclear) [Tetrahymena thermophila SB210]|uniref:Histidine phosphatase family (Branch 2) protein n=1 Tax=Tetrahymena thermophila (strain SB210) TaxID=312017 RepID=I7M8I4_TETTS|nr:histidine phosphatase family (branch 2) protein [Tetrahymena thermophila SB210]EAR98237.1 histidine phosphatase family (branch 2) protein [Tetrahymena thermophila SB210]|eukprot:XP_001018482.1 histidine phosphatase family (branch 2) protein [Tetrahymena thermophila SB210]
MSAKVLLLLVVFSIAAQSQLDGAQLNKVIVVFRHGARYPNYNSKAPIYNTDQTKTNSGQLSPVGARQLFQLGSSLRNEYFTNKKFIPEKFSSSQFYIRSTDSDRTIMSAQSFMAGLYPAGTGPTISATITSDNDKVKHLNPPYSNLAAQPGDNNSVANAYQPVPIRTVQNKYDGALYIHGNACQNSIQWINDAANGPLFKEYRQFFDKQFQDFEKLFSKYGFQASSSTLSTLYEWLDVLQCNLWNDNPAQDDSSKSFYADADLSKKIKIAVNLQFYFSYFLTEQQKKVVPTPFFSDLLKYTGDTHKPIFTVLSAHDTTINTVLLGLNLVNYQCLIDYIKNDYKPVNGKVCITQDTDFASNVVFEIVTKDNKKYIQVKYNGEYQKICDQSQTYCELTDFQNRVNQFIVPDYDVQCGNPIPQTQNLQTQQTVGESDNSAPGWSIALIVIFGVLFSITMVVAFYFYKSSRRFKQYMSAKQEKEITTV